MKNKTYELHYMEFFKTKTAINYVLAINIPLERLHVRQQLKACIKVSVISYRLLCEDVNAYIAPINKPFNEQTRFYLSQRFYL